MRPLALLLILAASAHAQLRAGAAAVDITPPPGAPMPGYYYNRGGDGVHDPLHAKAMVLEHAGARAALVSCDLISDVAWAGLPGEIFTEPGQAIKLASPFRHTIVVGLANASPGYIPHRKAYAEGAYEVVSARCAEGSGELLAGKAVELLLKLHAAADARVALAREEKP